MRSDQGQPIRLSDYRVPDYLVDAVDLDIHLHETATRIRATLQLRPNPAGVAGAPLHLDGDGLVATAIALDGEPLPLGIAEPERLTLAEPPRRAFTLMVETLVDPSANSALMGLYRSGSAFCTQCEAEGFRRITYYLDRPDVLSVFTTRIEAERAVAPVLLGNGNPVAAGDVPGTDRHFAVWHDPHPKPSYLFAIVGGRLDVLRDATTTGAGRPVDLAVYVEPGKTAQAAYAMDALKRAMHWDERVFGRAYDLDVFNVVAVSDFNMGAMENKGLNIFNDKYVLASPELATDADYAGIETVIAHEYFHNWTGNRITCRDWFQLSLKEGLTVYRDQEFSADQRSRAVKRIADVRALRARQFAEDGGPLAHSVRPDAYSEINNFYTATIYEKGAEIIRMYRTLVGPEAFDRGMALYFDRYDGTAATVEDFLGCFAESSGRDLSQFFRWYVQAGTPRVTATTRYDAATRVLTLDLAQDTPPTPGQPVKRPVVVPLRFGLVRRDGTEQPVRTGAEAGLSATEHDHGVIELSTPSRRLRFEDVAPGTVPSLLRGFSAPVRLTTDATDADLVTLMTHDEDAFNRWDAAQTVLSRLVLAGLRGGPAEPAPLRAALSAVIETGARDPAFAAQVLTLPAVSELAHEIGRDVDPDALHAARERVRAGIGTMLAPAFRAVLAAGRNAGPYAPDAAGAGARAFRNAALSLLAAGDPENGAALALAQFDGADNMTDRLAALSVLGLVPGAAREAALARFYSDFADHALVVDKWFALQAAIPEADTPERVRRLMEHPAFSLAVPNRVYALIGGFGANPTQFNRPDGAGYDLVASVVILLDGKNPQVASRLLGAFRSWRLMEPGRRAKAEAALRRVSGQPALSPDVKDIAARSLG
ncbi:aminopeptidase N [Lichenibacterium ramalinae]|uniref:Aminopeptidase N n=1 Tax=Lichenibacterium ramalinae TaxID=2316527 RepID=A0A4Q2RHJ6_9HYPH|nr:aminopeptidase N [Lichenibacterium ramalinae]RYB05578.1 aminopeptidase N [Lichenibacterium ramalinae]